jgi:hypothetical protein
VAMKCFVYWDITLCSPLKVNRRFGGIYCLHIQGRRINQAKNQREALCLLPGSCRFFLLWLLLDPEDGNNIFYETLGSLQTTQRFSVCRVLLDGFSLGVFFDSDAGSEKFLRNIRICPKCTALVYLPPLSQRFLALLTLRL